MGVRPPLQVQPVPDRGHVPPPFLLEPHLRSAEDFSGQFNRGSDEDGIIPHIVSLADILVGDELGVTKAQGTLIQGAPPSAWFLEILPVWVGVKGLSDMLWLSQPRVALIQQGEGDAAGKGPLKEIVKGTWQHTNVEREMCALTTAIAIEKCRHLQLVTILMCVESWAEALEVGLGFGLL